MSDDDRLKKMLACLYLTDTPHDAIEEIKQTIADQDKIICGLRDAGDIALHFLTQIAINDETPPDLAGYAADGAKPLSDALANSDAAGERALVAEWKRGHADGAESAKLAYEEAVEKARAEEARKVAGRLLVRRLNY
jgi:hypothetical protein